MRDERISKVLRDDRAIEVGERMRAFLDDPMIDGWFVQTRADHVERLLRAIFAGDEPAIRSIGQAILALDGLFRELSGAVKAGDVAKKKQETDHAR